MEECIMAQKKKKKKTKRVCNRCDREFLSEGKFNRICPNCNEINSNSHADAITGRPF